MKVGAAIMAHAVRKTHAAALAESLDWKVPVVYDAVPTPSADPEQRWATARRTWRLLAADDTDYSVVLQDDAIVCQDFLAGLGAALDVVGPQGLVSPYTGTGRPSQANVKRALAHADAHGHAWMSTRSLNWGVAIAMPTSMVDRMLRWCCHPARKGWNTDYRIGVWFRDVIGWRTWYTVPSLVDHDAIPSLVGHGDGRVAHRFLGTGNSALTVDWTRTPPSGLIPRL